MEHYTVTGMSCAACSVRVEKAVAAVPGVTGVSVSLLTNTMGVEGTASAADVIKAVTDAGYGAKPRDEAAGCYTVLTGWELNPEIAAAAMACSSVIVCTNALRLNRINIRDGRASRPKKSFFGRNENKEDLESVLDVLTGKNDNRTKPIQAMEEETKMTKTMTIEGMMCPHCEATVKKALEALDGVTSAEVSHEKGTAIVDLSADVADTVLTQAVEEKDFAVKGIA